ncbi:MAG: hypothetical protein PHX83_03320 [Acidobacteriia bacterium]|nr:hypothetical protein [Terriglobia bacterium]
MEFLPQAQKYTEEPKSLHSSCPARGIACQVAEKQILECGGKSADGGRDAALDSRIEKRAARKSMTGIKELRATIQSAAAGGAFQNGPSPPWKFSFSQPPSVVSRKLFEEVSFALA